MFDIPHFYMKHEHFYKTLKKVNKFVKSSFFIRNNPYNKKIVLNFLSMFKVVKVF